MTTAEWRRQRAIRAARQRRARELAPIHAEIAHAIEQLGWHTARPIVADTIGHAHGGRNGSWRHKVGKRNGTRLLARLHAIPVQGVLFAPAQEPTIDGEPRAPPT